MEGNVFKISRFCTHDGPGIRTVVFVKGCPLSCIWCHNPESQRGAFEIMYDKDKCVSCKMCAAACENGCHSFEMESHLFDISACSSCASCSKVCPTGALSIIGEKMTPEAVLYEIEKDKVFYGDKGGVTVSGGEPLYSPGFTSRLLELCREKGINTAIETSGFTDRKSFIKVVSLCDTVLFDLKETDSDRHKRYTGVPLAPILENMRILNGMGIPFVIRLPVIPGLNDRDEHFKAVRNIADSMKSSIGVEVMPYHRLGAYKYTQLGKEYLCRNISEPDDDTIRRWRELVNSSLAVGEKLCQSLSLRERWHGIAVTERAKASIFTKPSQSRFRSTALPKGEPFC